MSQETTRAWQLHHEAVVRMVKFDRQPPIIRHILNYGNVCIQLPAWRPLSEREALSKVKGIGP